MDGILTSMTGENGEIYAAPYGRSLPLLYCNNEVLAEAGWVSSDIKTNEDLFACAKDIYASTGKPGFAIYWDSDLWHWESEIYANGGSVLSEDGSKTTFGKDYDYVGAKFVKDIQDGLLEGYVTSCYTAPDAYDELTLELTTGQIGMIMVSSNGIPNRVAAAAENGYTLSTVVQPAGEAGYAITSGGSNWVMSNDLDEDIKYIAGGFLAYIESAENVMRFTENTGSMMIVKSALESEAGKQLLIDEPCFQAVYDSIQYMHSRPNSIYWAEMYTYGSDKLEQFTLNPADYDVYELIDDLDAKFTQIIADNQW